MVSVTRFDVGKASKAVRLDNGWLRVPAHLTKVGVFEYRRADGSVRRELRTPEEVFAEESLSSFAQVPVTDDHPPVELDDSNTGTYSKGSVGENVKRDGEYVGANLLVTDGPTIQKIQMGKQEVSCGYKCDLDETPGVWNGQRYDAIQKNIRGNHVALVLKGRAGPDVRLRMDSSDAAMLLSEIEQTVETVKDFEGSQMAKVRLDGVEFEVPENAAQAIAKIEAQTAKQLKSLHEARKDANAEADKQAARADAAEAKAKELEAALAAAPAKAKAELEARYSLESSAAKVLGKETKFDGQSDRDVMVSVVAKADSAFRADGKSDDYVRARFDLAVESASKTNRAHDNARAQLKVKRTDAELDPVAEPNSGDAKAKMNARIRNDWQEPLASRK